MAKHPSGFARFGAIVVTVGSVWLAACFSDRPSTGPEPVDGTEVTIDNFAFVPVQLRVTTGATVTWTNADAVAHTVSADDDTSFDSGALSPGQTFQTVAGAPGTYSYTCHFHPFMTAKLIVTP